MPHFFPSKFIDPLLACPKFFPDDKKLCSHLWKVSTSDHNNEKQLLDDLAIPVGKTSNYGKAELLENPNRVILQL